MKQTDAPTATPVDSDDPEVLATRLIVSLDIARVPVGTDIADVQDARRIIVAHLEGAALSDSTAGNMLRGLADEIDPPQRPMRLPGHGPGVRGLRSGDLLADGVVRVDDGTTAPVTRSR